VNCIWITTDSFRQDHVHCYRPEGTVDDTGPSLGVRTPSLDQLAAEGVRGNRLCSEALPTIPCRRGILAGQRVFRWSAEPFYKGVYVHLPGWRPIPQADVTVTGHGPMVAAWRENWLYLRNTKLGTAALYDLAEDTHRKRNVADGHPEVVRQLARAMHKTEA